MPRLVGRQLRCCSADGRRSFARLDYLIGIVFSGRTRNLGARPLPLADMVATLAGFAPVVVLSNQDPPASLSALVAAGAADFVPFATGDELRFPDVTACFAACFQKHLHSTRRLIPEFCAPSGAEQPIQLQTFGEMLRHELNNPLTGILGNAELLLAETRRQNNAAFSAPGVKRLETICCSCRPHARNGSPS